MKSFYITKEDGGILAALKGIPEDAKYLVIVCHGFLGGKENRGKIFPFTHKLNARGFGVLAFDFTGSGESSGNFATVTLSRQISDLNAVINYAIKEIKLPIILLGRSFGGSTIIGLNQNLETILGYILWSVPVDLVITFKIMLKEHYRKLESGIPVKVEENETVLELQPDLVADFNKIDLRQRLVPLQSKPVLICHGLADEVVDFSNAVYLHENLPLSKLKLVKDADHRFTDFIELREKLTAQWLEENFMR